MRGCEREAEYINTFEQPNTGSIGFKTWKYEAVFCEKCAEMWWNDEMPAGIIRHSYWSMGGNRRQVEEIWIEPIEEDRRE